VCVCVCVCVCVFVSPEDRGLDNGVKLKFPLSAQYCNHGVVVIGGGGVIRGHSE